MEDVVLHFPSGVAELGSLLETTQKLLAPFPRRPAPLFSPWFPSDAAQRPPPIRPARPAPVITASTPPLLVSNSSSDAHTATREDKRQKHEASIPPQGSYTRALPPETVQTGGDFLCLSETPLHLLPASPPRQRRRQLSPDEPQTGGAAAAAAAAAGFSGADSPIKRTWSVFSSQSGGGALLQSGGARSLSGAFGRVVALHKLHLRQRAKWVIGRSNCGPDRDLEQVWRSLSRSVRSSRLPTCNANIQRERAEIWVFCDVLHSEQVGRLLKEQLQLSGRISLSVRRLGNVFTA